MNRIKPVPQRLQQYVAYINNTGRVPLYKEMFTEDHEPIGEMVLRDLVENGVITMGGEGSFSSEPGIYLRPDLAN